MQLPLTIDEEELSRIVKRHLSVAFLEANVKHYVKQALKPIVQEMDLRADLAKAVSKRAECLTDGMLEHYAKVSMGEGIDYAINHNSDFGIWLAERDKQLRLEYAASLKEEQK